ncbi:MAG: hypothetical protein IPG96_07325 [Proteobacteria bacterium]|nr:hypothetical protein [Pseudomonadota bacterium]
MEAEQRGKLAGARGQGRRAAGATWALGLAASCVVAGACTSSDGGKDHADARGTRDGGADLKSARADAGGGVQRDARPPADLGSDGPVLPAGWSAGRSMASVRAQHTATLLSDGTILVAGGVGTGSDALASAERYDPRTDTWQAAGTMTTGHVFHEAVRLLDGRVLIVGGCANTWGNCTYVGAELFDPSQPAATAFTATGAMPKLRRSHRATLLDNGEVLVTGGYDNLGSHLTINLYNPQTNSWRSPLGALSVARHLATVTKLGDGRVLIGGGADGSKVHDTLEVYDPATGQATTLTAKLGHARFKHSATRLSDGRVLFVGGLCDVATDCFVPTSEIFDPATGGVSSAGSPASAVLNHQATLLADGRVLVSGGHGGPWGDAVSLFTLGPPAGWTTGPDLVPGRVLHTATAIGSRVIVIGGEHHYEELATTAIYVP